MTNETCVALLQTSTLKSLESWTYNIARCIMVLMGLSLESKPHLALIGEPFWSSLCPLPLKSSLLVSLQKQSI